MTAMTGAMIGATIGETTGGTITDGTITGGMTDATTTERMTTEEMIGETTASGMIGMTVATAGTTAVSGATTGAKKNRNPATVSCLFWRSLEKKEVRRF